MSEEDFIRWLRPASKLNMSGTPDIEIEMTRTEAIGDGVVDGGVDAGGGVGAGDGGGVVQLTAAQLTAAQPTAAQPLAPLAAQLPAAQLAARSSLRNRLQSWLSALPPCPLSPMCCCMWSICLAAICLAALPQALLWLWQVGPVDSIDVQHG